MRIAIVSYQGDSSGLAYRLMQEGNQVHIWTQKKVKYLENLDDIYHERVKLETFIGKFATDLIIFDGQEYGKTQTILRKQGMKVIGSSVLGEKIEDDRILQYKIARYLNIKMPDTFIFDDIDEAIKFLKREKVPYIMKQNDNLPKSFNFKTQIPDNTDLIMHLYALKKKYPQIRGNFVLQKIVDGVEVATSGFYTQSGWLKGEGGEILLEVNFEHKALLEGDRGISTGEMGTVAWFVEGENRIFNEMIRPLEPLLSKFLNFGNVDANCIVTPEGELYLLEWTIRFGYPITDLYLELVPDVTDFVNKILTGGIVKVDEFPTVGIVWVLGFPVFPYEKAKGKIESFLYEQLIFTDRNVFDHFHPGFVSWDKKNKTWYISDNYGYAGTITVKGQDLEKIMKIGVKMIESIIPAKKGFYRRDIGERVIKALKEDFVWDVIITDTQSKAEHSKAKQSNEEATKEVEEEWRRFKISDLNSAKLRT